MKRLFLGTCFAVATSSVGCSSSDTATEADYDDVAQALGSVIVTDNGGGDVGSMVDSTMIALGTPDISIKVEANGKYTGSHLGLDYTYAVSCADADGGALAKCDKTTDKADVSINWSGDLALPHVSAAVERDGTWKLSGLQSGVVNIAGESDFTLEAQLQSLFRAATRSYLLSYSADYADVKLDKTARRLVGGSVTYEIDAERKASGTRSESEAQFQMDGVLKFNADGSASLTLDESHAYKVTVLGTVEKQ